MIVREIPFGKGDSRLLCVDRKEKIESAAKEIQEAGFEIQVCLIEDIVTISIRHAEDEYEVVNAAAPNGPAFLRALDDTVSMYAAKLKDA